LNEARKHEMEGTIEKENQGVQDWLTEIRNKKREGRRRGEKTSACQIPHVDPLNGEGKGLKRQGRGAARDNSDPIDRNER